MISKPLWQSIKMLVDCDRQIFKTEKEIAEKQHAGERDRTTIREIQDLIKNIKQQCVDNEKKVAFQELQSNHLKSEEDDKKEHLLRVVNEKEYDALKKEISIVVKERERQENLLMGVWNDLEVAKKRYADEKDIHEKKIADLHGLIAKNKESVELLQTTLSEAKCARETYAKEITPEWLSCYERMKHKVPNPIVSITQGSCSSCYYQVLQQDLFELKKSELLPCRNCYRLLYYDAEQEKKDTEKDTGKDGAKKGSSGTEKEKTGSLSA